MLLIRGPFIYELHDIRSLHPMSSCMMLDHHVKIQYVVVFLQKVVCWYKSCVVEIVSEVFFLANFEVTDLTLDHSKVAPEP